jgi:hypothetical protein
MVGERVMISSASIAELRAENFGWITALKSGQIHTLINDGQLKLGLFDHRNLFELSHPGLPTERLVTAESALDGIYVIRAGVPKRTMSSGDAVRNYKALSSVERTFRSLKTVDFMVRFIHHRLENRVRAHILLCMSPTMWSGTCARHGRNRFLPTRIRRDPVVPARRSGAAEEKASSKQLDDGTPVHSFRTPLEKLSPIVRNTCRVPLTAPTFPLLTIPNDLQLRARELIDKITPLTETQSTKPSLGPCRPREILLHRGGNFRLKISEREVRLMKRRQLHAGVAAELGDLGIEPRLRARPDRGGCAPIGRRG